MITIYPAAIQQSSSFANNAELTLTALSLPVTASLAGFSLGNPGPTGPTYTIQANFVSSTP